MDWQSSPDESVKESFGSWVSVEYNHASTHLKTNGELIAVFLDSMFVLDPDHLVSIPINEIARARLSAYESASGNLALWMVGGVVSTASHGFFLILSVPLWLISGTIAMVARSYEPEFKYPGDSLDQFRAFSRFPQGLTPDIDRTKLVRKFPQLR